VIVVVLITGSYRVHCGFISLCSHSWPKTKQSGHECPTEKRQTVTADVGRI
jgi:hypothetical protein